MEDERIKLGWAIDLEDYPFVLCAYGDNGERERALKLCRDADVLILGAAPYEFVADRVRNNKLTFYYAERLFRNGIWHLLNPRTFLTVLKRFVIPGRKSNFYLLAASAYTAIDTAKIFAFDQGRFKWGHFIEVAYPASRQQIGSSDKLKLLWAGRFLKLKHPDYAIRVARSLKKAGTQFHLDIIGAGPEEKYLQRLISDYELTDVVSMHRPMTPAQVRRYMERADIYLFTSDFNEGWGAVLGEAMISGCATVASHGIGATPFLVKHNHNGLIYRTGDYASFQSNVLRLAEDKQLRLYLSSNAIRTMMELWNPKVGAERFYELCKSIIQNGKPIYCEEGPLSKAELLKNNWFKDDTIQV